MCVCDSASIVLRATEAWEQTVGTGTIWPNRNVNPCTKQFTDWARESGNTDSIETGTRKGPWYWVLGRLWWTLVAWEPSVRLVNADCWACPRFWLSRSGWVSNLHFRQVCQWCWGCLSRYHTGREPRARDTGPLLPGSQNPSLNEDSDRWFWEQDEQIPTSWASTHTVSPMLCDCTRNQCRLPSRAGYQWRSYCLEQRPLQQIPRGWVMSPQGKHSLFLLFQEEASSVFPQSHHTSLCIF